MTTALLTGLGLGFLVAAQVGPIWLLAARSVILGRLTTGIMIGLGAATIDTTDGALGLAGAASLLRISGLRLGLGLLGAASWFTVLSTTMALVRRLAGRRVHQVINVICGLGLIVFGIVLAWQTAAAVSP